MIPDFDGEPLSDEELARLVVFLAPKHPMLAAEVAGMAIERQWRAGWAEQTGASS